MSKRVSPAERLRAEIDGVFAGGEDLSRAISSRSPSSVRGCCCSLRWRPR